MNYTNAFQNMKKSLKYPGCSGSYMRKKDYKSQIAIIGWMFSFQTCSSKKLESIEVIKCIVQLCCVFTLKTKCKNQTCVSVLIIETLEWWREKTGVYNRYCFNSLGIVSSTQYNTKHLYRKGKKCHIKKVKYFIVS